MFCHCTPKISPQIISRSSNNIFIFYYILVHKFEIIYYFNYLKFHFFLSLSISIFRVRLSLSYSFAIRSILPLQTVYILYLHENRRPEKKRTLLYYVWKFIKYSWYYSIVLCSFVSLRLLILSAICKTIPFSVELVPLGWLLLLLFVPLELRKMCNIHSRSKWRAIQ